MYQQEDLRFVSAQERKRTALCLLPVGALLAGVVLSFLHREKGLTIALFILAGFITLFCHGVLIAPVTAYKKHLSYALGGRTRSTEGSFLRFGEHPVERDGVRFIPVSVRVERTGSEGDERLLYYDANLPLPSWKAGDFLQLDSHDKAIVRWRKAQT